MPSKCCAPQVIDASYVPGPFSFSHQELSLNLKVTVLIIMMHPLSLWGGAYFIWTPQKGFIERAAYSQKSDDTGVCDGFSVLLPSPVLRAKCTISAPFFPNHIKVNMQTYFTKKMENLWQILEFDISEGA